MAKKAVKVKPKVAPNPTPDEDDGQYGARPSLSKACPFCKHHYIRPCTEKTKDGCPNYKHLKGSKKR